MILMRLLVAFPLFSGALALREGPSTPPQRSLLKRAHLRQQSAWVPFVEKVTPVLAQNSRQSEEARFLLIVSAQRSASTSLTQTLAQQHECVYNCNEFFGGAQVDVQCREFKHIGEGEEALGRIQLARDDLCEHGMHEDFSNPGKPVEAAQECRDTCMVALKLFVGHGIFGQELADLLAHPQARVVVLERDPAERWCSLQEAMANHDWGIEPSHWERADNSTRPPCDHKASPELLEQHQGWYEEVRSILSERSIPHVEVPFDAFVQDSEAVTAKIWEFVEAH
eukprot:CAMPEP_0170621964 /NCGR_PEP_ID=MMETSP0224-20130122/28876_1 /TAXON_ID=285029 /ORGANISM="Togula jolla, Strain CCCM 725" /LENGTH=281 /DNA_ID=CAMNT_0010948247 /DNA_START=62 /DNA_END=907 /DNA_ORIENTATION=+